MSHKKITDVGFTPSQPRLLLQLIFESIRLGGGAVPGDEVSTPALEQNEASFP
jgi:hypothetical protein